MITDALLAFIPIGGNLSLIAAAGVDIPSTNTIDLLGQGVGTAPTNIIGNATLFGEDAGVGARFRPELNVTIGTAVTTGTSATLNVAFQAAPDTAVTYLPGTWQTLAETGELTAAQLTAGQVIARFPWLPAFPANLRPRYLRLLFQVPAGTTFTAGTIGSALVTTVRDDLANRYSPSNFVVG